MHVVIEQGSIISDWVWVTKGSLQFNKHCVIALVIMTKLMADQVPSLLTREEGGFIQGRSGESMRGTPEEQMKAKPVLPSCLLPQDGSGWAEKCWRLRFALGVQPLEQGVLRCLLQDFIIAQKGLKWGCLL